MKFVVQNLKLGDFIEAEVSEVLSLTEVIMSFRGDLLRIQNRLGKSLRTGEKLTCRVVAVEPLRFELFAPRSSQMMDRIV